ncbi:phospholipase D-like domain-containing protein [Noviherbaspirillum galbum]|uniref:Cardiolipin synthase B n=1 Tax=Noviherbaspirillum galbum TaxID=2709383 RepID=A0A6B3SJA4_9BURK|nr:phospholipase D-like domain-containing protein [Noviherbaspirillum galbum]NEX60934.1 cardiolipin synthase B [Noviherbaspirillum galbum]
MRSVSFTAHNQVTLLHSGAEFFPALIRALDEAQAEILLETYIFAADETGEEVKVALKRAAARGVVVNVITDWLGTGHGQSRRLQEEFRQAGVHYRVFNAWFQRGVVRTHRKICVVDRRIAFLGGLNINHDLRADHNPSLLLPAPRWDFAVSIVGPLVESIHLEVEAQWMLLNRFNFRYRWRNFRGRFGVRPPPGDGPVLAGLVVRDNLRNRRTIQKAYMKALGGARESAMLVTPYFAPGRKLRQALAKAASRGVSVTLLLGVGQFRIQDAVAHSFYPKLLKAGVRIVEYTKTQLHGKVGVIDDYWATVGSSNWDGLSLLLNQEANVVIHDADFALRLREHIERGIADGTPVRLEDYVNKPWYKRLMYGAAYIFYRTVLRVIAADRYEE